MPSELKVNKLSPYTGTTLTLGDSGDTVSTDAVVQASQFVGGGLNAYRNLIINGDMQIAQRSTSVTGITTSGYYTIDRFLTTESTGGVYTQSQSTDVPTGQGFSYSLKMETTTADTMTTTESLRIGPRLEGQNLQLLKFGTSNAESLTLSFWVKSNKTGDYVARLLNINSGTDRQVTGVYTINSANTWEKKTFTFAGDTTGSFDNDNEDGLRLEMILAAGPDLTSGTQPTVWSNNNGVDSMVGQTVNIADTIGNTWYITGLQLEVGTSASDFEFLPYDVNLKRCQRYYQRIQGNASDQVAIGTGYADATCALRYYHHLFTTMRAEPSVSENDLASLGRATQVADINIIQTFDESTETVGLDIVAASGTPYTTFDVQMIRLNTNADAYLEFDAEL